jgi:DNA replication protein DnaC
LSVVGLQADVIDITKGRPPRQNDGMSRQPRLDLRPGVSEPVVLLISRREVDAGDIASVLSRLKPFLASREETWRYRGQMTLVVDGYNHDPRELVDIPEVRTLLRRLEASWPCWAFFFNQVDDSITLLLSCVAGSRFPGRGAVEMDAELVRELRLSGIAATLSTRVMQAQSTQEPFLDTFAAMLQDELDRRRSRLTERRFKHSRLDERPTLADFDWRFNPKLPRQACFELHTLKFVSEGGNALIIGKPGTGKSHVAKAVAYQATLQGFDVRYVEADTEFARHALGSTPEQAALLRSFVEPDLVVLDDLFLARRISEASAELLQTVVHQRYKQRRSIVVTSNRVVQDWGKYLGDATMATTILDRLMHRAAMLEFEGKSYRLKEAASRLALTTTDSP